MTELLPKTRSAPTIRKTPRTRMNLELKEPDFDPLRGRDDFKKLFAEVETKANPTKKDK